MENIDTSGILAQRQQQIVRKSRENEVIEAHRDAMRQNVDPRLIADSLYKDMPYLRAVGWQPTI